MSPQERTHRQGFIETGKHITLNKRENWLISAVTHGLNKSRARCQGGERGGSMFNFKHRIRPLTRPYLLSPRKHSSS